MGLRELNVDLTKDHVALWDATKKFMKEVWRPAAIELDKLPNPEDVIAEGSVLWDVLRQSYELGYHSMFFPAEFGGMETHIWFDLAQTSMVELSVYDIRGRLVRQLIPGKGCEALEMEAGLYGREGGEGADPCVSFSWNGLDDRGRVVEGGVYLLRLRAGGVVDVRRVIFWP